MGPVSIELVHITVDCDDAGRLASFWAQALGWDVAPDASPEFAMVGGGARPADAPGWVFFRVPEGKSAKNRMHVDLEADDLDAETVRLVELGAAVVHEKQEWGAHWRTLTDPEGNEFCVVATAEDDPAESVQDQATA
jgi:predicted enzyme related to lactoylglutathione lyase